MKTAGTRPSTAKFPLKTLGTVNIRSAPSKAASRAKYAKGGK